MKKYLLLLLLNVLFLSCKNSWNEPGDKTFYKACLDDAKTWPTSPENAITYCNCVIAKVNEKYPDKDDAMKHIGILYNDKDLQACKDSLMKK